MTVPEAVYLVLQAGRLNAMTLGEETAAGVGVNVEGTRRRIFFVSSLVVGLVVSKSGMIGFVGLIVQEPETMLPAVLLFVDHSAIFPSETICASRPI